MPTLVEKLQLDAMDKNVSVTDLLRRVKFTAAKLGLAKVEDWVEKELSGWDSNPPDYRTVRGAPMIHNPYRGYEPLGGAPDWMTRRPNTSAISAIESLAAEATSQGGQLHMPFPDKVTAAINKSNGVQGYNCYLVIPASELVRIIDRVRTLVLDWALNLEKAGITGSEATFNDSDKQKAQAASMTINIGSIGNFAGNLGQGNVSGDNSIDRSQVQAVLDQLKPHVSALGKAGADEKALADRIDQIEKAMSGKADVLTLGGLLTDLRNTLSGAAGNLIATGAIGMLNTILGTGVPRP